MNLATKTSLPYAASIKRLEQMFGYSKSVIRRWDAAGYLTRYQAPHASASGKNAPVRYVIADFLEFLESQPGSRLGSFAGRKLAELGDILQ